jgi:hypothetical protein
LVLEDLAGRRGVDLDIVLFALVLDHHYGERVSVATMTSRRQSTYR